MNDVRQSMTFPNQVQVKRGNLRICWTLISSVMGMMLLVLMSGCVTPEVLPNRKPTDIQTEKGQAVEMAVVVEPRIIEQNSQRIQGLIIQVVLLDSMASRQQVTEA